MEEPNSRIIYPVVSAEESDPYARVNVMIDMLNYGRDANNKPDMGLFHEICTAIYLIAHGKITHGCQISRSLTTAERESRKKSTSQSIVVPIGKGNYRELDMLYEENGRIHIVEAKNARRSDTHQLKLNVALAHRLGGAVVYTLREDFGQERALKEQYSAIPKAQQLPPLVVHQIPRDEISPKQWLCPLPTVAEMADRPDMRSENWYQSNLRLWYAYNVFPYGTRNPRTTYPIAPRLPTYIPKGEEAPVAGNSAAQQ